MKTPTDSNERKVKNKTIRLFVSSTFNDFILERRILNEEIFPEIEEYCKSKGFNFQVVDLRYGVPRGASKDNSTMKICLEEVKRCQATGYYLNFLMLVGNRYGWNPEPVYMEKNDFDMVMEYIEHNYPVAADKIKKYYILDNNQCPPSYFLVNEADLRQMGDTDGSQWEELNHFRNEMGRIFSEVFKNNVLNWEKSNRYFLSATGQEIWNGLLEVDDKEQLKHIISVFRNFEKMERYYDIDESKKKDLKNLKDKIAAHFKDVLGAEGDKLIHRFDSEDSDDSCRIDVKKFKEKMREALKEVADLSMEQYHKLDYKEQDIHRLFLEDRLKVFYGRRKEINSLCRFALSKRKDNLDGAMIFTAERGSGKTSIMAKAIKECEDKNDKDIVYRFVGASSESSDSFMLVQGLYEQICNIYGFDYVRKETYSGVCAAFSGALKMIPDDRELVLFVDAVDQLFDRDAIDGLTWIPGENDIPKNVHIILSCIKDKKCMALKQLKKKLPHAKETEVKSTLDDKDIKAIMKNYLAAEERTLTEEQYAEVVKQYRNVNRPIYLKYLTNLVKNLRSYDELDFSKYEQPDDKNTVSSLPDKYISDIVNTYLSQLSDSIKHGSALVRYTFGFLLASKDGVSEQEMLRLLGRNEDVKTQYKDVYFSDNSDPLETNKELPFMVWSRLYYQIHNSLKTVNVDDMELLDFYHLSLRDVVEQGICKGKVIRKAHSEMAAYFENQPDFYDDNKETPNMRRLTELPYQYMWMIANLLTKEDKKKAADKMYSMLIGDDYIYAKCCSGNLGQLVEELYYLLNKELLSENKKKKLSKIFLKKVIEYNIAAKTYDSFLEDIHSILVFKKNKDIHKDVFSNGTSYDAVYEQMPEMNENKRKFFAQFISLQCNMKLVNEERRFGDIKKAIATIEEIKGEKGFTKLENSRYDYEDDQELKKRVNEEKSRLFYDISYVNYLMGNSKEAVKYMTKSIDYADEDKNLIGNLISKCVMTQIKLYTAFDNASNKQLNDILTEMICFLESAKKVFIKKSSSSENASRWVMNADSYLILAYYLRGRLGQDNSASDMAKVGTNYNHYWTTPWIQRRSGVVDSYAVFKYSAEGKVNECYDELQLMKDRISIYFRKTKRNKTNPWNSDFYTLEIYKFLAVCNDLCKLCSDKKKQLEDNDAETEKLSEMISDIMKMADKIYTTAKSAEGEKIKGNMYFNKAIDKEFGQIYKYKKGNS